MNDLEGSLKKLQKDINNREKLQNALAVNAKFSAYLVALSNAILPGVWLSEMDFSRNDHRIRLKGHALRTPAVQLFINQLSRQAVFAQEEFRIEDLTEVIVDNQKIIDFVIANKPMKPI